MCTNLLCFFMKICTFCSWYISTPLNTGVFLCSFNIILIVINLIFCLVYVSFTLFTSSYCLYLWWNCLLILDIYTVHFIIIFHPFIISFVYCFIIHWNFLIINISRAVCFRDNFIFWFICFWLWQHWYILLVNLL